MDNFPHLNINVEDDSSYNYVDVEQLPLHRPIYFIKAATGKVGQITWVPNAAKARAYFGDATFDPVHKEYFSRSTMFALTTLENGGGCFLVRIGDNTMTRARAVVWASVDSNTDTIDIAITPGSVSGFGKEVIDVTNNVTTFPLFDFQATNVGVYGNDLGIRLFPDGDLSSDETDRIDSMLYRIGFTIKNAKTNVADKLRTKYSVFDFQFATKKGAYDPATGVDVDYDHTIGRYFDAEYPAPIETHVYSDFIDEYIELITTKWSMSDYIADDSEDHFGRIDFLNLKIYSPTEVVSMYNEDDPANSILGAAPTWSVVYPQGGEITSDTPIFTRMSNIPMSAGSDGALEGINIDSATTVGSSSAKAYAEALISNILDPTKTPFIVDKARYPFNNIIDTGWGSSLKTTATMLLAERDDIKVVLSVWDGVTDLDDVGTVVSSASNLVSTIRGISESELFGTKAYRGTVFGQYGELNDPRFEELAPMTIWYAAKKAEFGSKDYIDEIPAGLPNAEVTMFKPETINVIPALKSELRSLWDTCVNYCQYSDMDTLFIAGIRGVYDNDTSVLASDTFADASIYLKQLALPIYNKYASVETKNTQDLYSLVTTEANEKFNHMLGGRYSAEVSMYQTEEEAKIGFIHHMRVVLTGGPAFRVVNLDIICKRTGFNGE